MTKKSTGPTSLRCIRTILSRGLLLLFVCTGAVAQQRLDPVAIGMGRASVATSRGLSSMESNFGALGLDALGARDSIQHAELELTLLPFGASAGSTYLSADDIDFVFASKNREDFNDEDRLRLARLIEDGRLSADAALDLFALRLRAPGVGAIGIRYGHRVRAQMTFPENFRTDVLSSGDVFQKGDLFKDPEIGGEWTRNITLTLASAWNRPIERRTGATWFPSFGVGLNISYLEGIVHFEVDPDSWASTRRIPSAQGEPYRRIEVEGSYTFRSSEPRDSTFSPSSAILTPGFTVGGNNAAAVGWEGGCGISMVVLRTLNRSREQINGNPLQPQDIVIEDASERDAILFGIQIEGIGSLNWNGRNTRRRYQKIIDTLTDQNGPISNDIIYRYEAPLDTIGEFQSQLPAQVRVGLGVDVTAFVPSIPGDLITSMEGAFNLNQEIGGERENRFSLGAEWSPSRAFALRTGMQLGGRLGVAMSLGVGLRPFSWLAIDVATSEVTSLFFADRRRVDLALRASLRWQF